MPWIGLCLLMASLSTATAPGSLKRGFSSPPNEARLRCFWWWLNGNVTEAAITRDLEEMKEKGFGGVLLADGGGAEQDGNSQVPAGPAFLSDPWRELFRHALREADRLGLEVSLNIQSGWNLGGPPVTPERSSRPSPCAIACRWNLGGPPVTPERAAKRLIFAESAVSGPLRSEHILPTPSYKLNLYRDVAVVAFPAPRGKTLSIEQLELKWALHELGPSAPDGAVLLDDRPAVEGESACPLDSVVDLTGRMDANGRLRWEVPAGDWVVQRFGYTGTGARVSTHSEGWGGLVLDHLSREDLRWYLAEVVDPLVRDAGPLAGETLKYLTTDSWECGGMNWTPAFREEFRKRRGYDLLPFLPVLTGHLVGNREISNRFLEDFRKTIGECVADNHYQIMRDYARRYNLGVHPESGGPHGAPIDSLRCLGLSDIPMSEFWAKSWRHRVTDENRFFVKQPASAAHTYGRKLVAAEGFTTIGPHWQETLWDNLKPSFDQAACEGLNRLFWTLVTCSPLEMGVPGQQFFAGTHFNPNSTWWSKSGPFLNYINRCQHMLQQGLFVADVLYYYGDHVPNFAQFKRSDPARVLPGYDYDVATEEVVLTRLQARDGKLVLPDGMTYRVLVLRQLSSISLPVLRKVAELAKAGVPVVGERPRRTSGLAGWPESDLEAHRLAAAIPFAPPGSVREILSGLGVPQDLEISGGVSLEWIHRKLRETDIYFLSNQEARRISAETTFRVTGKAPELWNPVTGETRDLPEYWSENGRTVVPLRFEPYEAYFVVFEKEALGKRPQRAPGAGSAPPHILLSPREPREANPSARNFPASRVALEFSGPWQVEFHPKWSGLDRPVVFDRLDDWTARPEEGIRYYSGSAVYRKVFALKGGAHKALNEASPLFLDIGVVREMAQVRLNGEDLGVLWCAPWRTEIRPGLLKDEDNLLEIEVVNFWPNRLIGDAGLPRGKRLTRTNVRKFDNPGGDPHYMNTMPSGLLGPVRLYQVDSQRAGLPAPPDTREPHRTAK